MSTKLSIKGLFAVLLLGGTALGQGSSSRPTINFSDATSVTSQPVFSAQPTANSVLSGQPSSSFAYSEPAPQVTQDWQVTNYSQVPAPAPAPAAKPDKPAPTCAKSHKGLFYANDFSYKNDPNYSGYCLGDRLKGISVGRNGKLDFGGQLRHRYHSERGQGNSTLNSLGFNDTDNDFSLARLRLYANYEINDRFRFFAEGIFAEVAANDEYIPRGIDRNRGDFLNLFLDVKLPNLFDTNVRVGRQELSFGDQRLISPLDWANVRRTFEGVSTQSQVGDINLSTFWTELVPVDFDDFDEANENIRFFGVYSSFTGFNNSTIDAYWIGFDNDNAGAITNNFSLNTFGARLNGKTRQDLLYDFEGGFQFGSQDGLGTGHEAEFWTLGLGYQFKNLLWSPTLWGYYDFASGDDSSEADFNRFNALQPLGHKYLGFLDAVNRSNIRSPNARLTFSPTRKTKLLFWYYYFQADQIDDIIPGVAVQADQDFSSDEFGNELDILVSHQLTPRANVTAGYSYFWRGDRIIGTNDASFFYLQSTLNF